MEMDSRGGGRAVAVLIQDMARTSRRRICLMWMSTGKRRNLRKIAWL